MGTTFFYHWLFVIFLMAMVILYPERPAWGDPLDPYLGSPDAQVVWEEWVTAFPNGGDRVRLDENMVQEGQHKKLDGMAPYGYLRPAITVMILEPFQTDIKAPWTAPTKIAPWGSDY
jgi:hypothetical protein